MLARFRKRLTYANVISSIALFLALGGGAYALTIPSNSVGSKQLKRNAVTTKKIKRNAVTSAKIKNSSLLIKDFRSGQLPRGGSGRRGARGLRGLTGRRGATGKQGPAGPGARWVLVQGSNGGVLARSDASITVTRDAAGGLYYVNFGSSVLNKLIVATLNRTGGGQTGEVAAGACGGSGAGASSCAQSNSSSTVLVETTSSAGAGADRNFFLAVIP